MIAMELPSQLRALREPPPQSGFEARLHNALLREANLMQANQRPQRKLLRWLPERRQWRVGLLVLALSASAAAMLVAHAVRRQTAPEPMKAAAPAVSALPRTHVGARHALDPSTALRAHAGAVPLPPSASPAGASPSIAPLPTPQRLHLPQVASPTAGELRSSLVKPNSNEAPPRLLEVTPEEPPKLALDRLGLPEDLPAPALEHRANPPHLRGRPALDLPERRNGERPERTDSATKRRDQRSERSRSKNAERGLERAREAQQQHVRQR